MPLPTRKKKAALSNNYNTGLMNTYTKLTALASTILLSGAIMAPANAAEPKVAEPQTATVEIPTVAQPAVLSTAASISFEAPKVTSVAAPVPVPEPQVTVPPAQNAPVAPAASQTQVRQAVQAPQVAPAAPAPKVAPAATPTPVPAFTPASGAGAALLASAYGQIGQVQDCTAMVERALGSIGIVSGDLAPAQFFKFGSVVGTPAPGDILISAGHVGIYAGNGQMISGGFNGNQTVLHPVSYVGGFSAVRVA